MSVIIKEQLAVVGGNASGKSIVAQQIAGRENVRYITFRDSYGYNGDRSFFMQQRWNLFTVDTFTPDAGEILRQAAEACPDSESANARLKELISLFGLEPLLDKLLVTLSSGELRKFQLTKALISQPKTLVIDNPYIGLDPAARKVLTRLLTTLAEEGLMSIILILAREEEIPPFITHILPVADGKAGEKVTVEEYAAANYPKEVIRLRNVSIRYEERTILDSLDWVVREGEHWALTGGNGSGKSTLLSLITADNPQGYACDIELFGRRRGTGESIWDIKKNIGFVSPEMHRSFASLNIPAIDIVSSGLFDTEGLFRTPSPEQKAATMKWMEIFGIANLANMLFTHLSSGQQRLCLVARAFVKDPLLYILDEPLHGLDNANRRMVKSIMDEYCGRPGKTLLMVTHYPEEYPSCIDHSLTL